MVPLDRALVSSYRLSIVTMSLSAAVWPQFATQSFPQRYVRTNSLLLIYFTDTGSSTIATNVDWPKSVTKLSNISGSNVKDNLMLCGGFFISTLTTGNIFPRVRVG